MEKRVEGKPVGFDIIRIGKTLIKLKDGNYIQITAEIEAYTFKTYQKTILRMTGPHEEDDC